MKKCLLIALACAALASCAKDEANAPNVNQTSDAKITFEAPIIAPTTRADETLANSTPYPQTWSFDVYAMWYAEKENADDFTKWSEGTNYMTKVAVSYKQDGVATGTDGWVPATDYWWPEDGSLTFQAYSPSATTGASIGATGVLFGDATNMYKAIITNNGQKDLMYSERTYDKKASSHTTDTGNASDIYNGVDIQFKHALSALRFTAALQAAYDTTTTPISITSIVLSGIKTEGHFNQNLADTKEAQQTTPASWTVGTEANAYENIIPSSGLPVTSTSATALKNASNEECNLLVIPQEFTSNDDAKIKVNYTVNGVPQVFTQQLNLLTYTETTTDDNGDEFKIGKQYTFNIVIALDKIYFAPVVTNWADVTVQDINNK